MLNQKKESEQQNGNDAGDDDVSKQRSHHVNERNPLLQILGGPRVHEHSNRHERT